MTTTYTYSIQNDITAKRCLADLLRSAINASEDISPDCQTISTGNGNVEITFDAELTPIEEAALDAIVLAHPGYTVEPEFITNTPIVGGQADITTQDWMTLGGVVTNATFFCAASDAYGEILGGANASGTGAQVRLVEDDNGDGGGTLVMGGPFDIPHGAWGVMRFGTTGHQPRDGARCYRLEGRLNGATSASVRFVSLSLFKLNVILGVTG